MLNKRVHKLHVALGLQ